MYENNDRMSQKGDHWLYTNLYSFTWQKAKIFSGANQNASFLLRLPNVPRQAHQLVYVIYMKTCLSDITDIITTYDSMPARAGKNIGLAKILSYEAPY
jgi:hypothetical protein